MNTLVKVAGIFTVVILSCMLVKSRYDNTYDELEAKMGHWVENHNGHIDGFSYTAGVPYLIDDEGDSYLSNDGKGKGLHLWGM